MLSLIRNRLKPLFRKKGPFIEKDTLYYELSESFQTDECPICHLLDRYEHRFMQSVFYESVNDGNLRKQIKESQGLCMRHTNQFLQTGDILGLSIIGVDLLESWMMTSDTEHHDFCLLCRLHNENEKRLTQAFIRYCDIDAFRKAFKSSAGLCRKHFRMIYKEIKEPTIADEIKQTEQIKIEKLIIDLYEVIRKHDYRFQQETIFNRETRAIRLVWNFLRK